MDSNMINEEVNEDDNKYNAKNNKGNDISIPVNNQNIQQPKRTKKHKNVSDDQDINTETNKNTKINNEIDTNQPSSMVPKRKMKSQKDSSNLNSSSGQPKRVRKQPFDSNAYSNPFGSNLLGTGGLFSESLNRDYFYINVQGLIENAYFYEDDKIFVKYDINFGENWTLLSGQKSGLSQHACQGEGTTNYFVWNMPFEISLKSNNPRGWPQLIISCYCPDYFGREVAKAYGTCYFPTTPGKHTRKLWAFSPISCKILDTSKFFFGEKSEIINPSKLISEGEGRELIKTQSEGSINVSFNIQVINLEEFGFD